MKTFGLCLLMGTLSALGERPVLAQNQEAADTTGAQKVESQSDTETLEAALSRGVNLRRAGKDQDALDLFSSLFAKSRSPRAQAQMGLARQALGLWTEAEVDLETALSTPENPWIETNRKALEQALDVIRKRLGSLDVRCDAPQTALWVDGRAVGNLPFEKPLRLVTGTVTVRIQAPGYTSVQRSVSIVSGQLSRETFHLMPIEPLPAPKEALSLSIRDTSSAPPPPPSRGQGLHRGFFWAAVAATAALTGATIWSGTDVLSANNQYKENPTAQAYNDGRDRERRTNFLLGGTIAVGVGTALLGLFATDFHLTP